jgi:hypothetical protein
MDFEFKSFDEIQKKNITEKETNPNEDIEGVEAKIDEEISNLEKNGAELVDTIDSLGGEEKIKEILENDKKEGGNIFKQLRNIILILGAISSIPIIYGIVNPESLDKFKAFYDKNSLVMLSSAIAVIALPMIISGLRSGELQKGIKEAFRECKKDFAPTNKKEKKDKDWMPERFR